MSSSHKLQPIKTLYTPYEGGMLTVVTALKAWRHYLLGPLFDLFSNNTAVIQSLLNLVLPHVRRGGLCSSQSMTFSTCTICLETQKYSQMY
eukprot:1152171-Pelagomonas_calceolata.AAC.12